MSVEVVPFKAEYLDEILNQPINVGQKQWLSREKIASVENTPWTFAVIGDGRVLVVGGFNELWPGRAEVWTIFNEDGKDQFVATFRTMRTVLKIAVTKGPFHRVEVAVPTDSEKFRRRVELLGFKLEAERMRGYLSNQVDCSLYAMVRN